MSLWMISSCSSAVRSVLFTLQMLFDDGISAIVRAIRPPFPIDSSETSETRQSSFEPVEIIGIPRQYPRKLYQYDPTLWHYLLFWLMNWETVLVFAISFKASISEVVHWFRHSSFTHAVVIRTYYNWFGGILRHRMTNLKFQFFLFCSVTDGLLHRPYDYGCAYHKYWYLLLNLWVTKYLTFHLIPDCPNAQFHAIIRWYVHQW